MNEKPRSRKERISTRISIVGAAIWPIGVLGSLLVAIIFGIPDDNPWVLATFMGSWALSPLIISVGLHIDRHGSDDNIFWTAWNGFWRNLMYGMIGLTIMVLWVRILVTWPQTSFYAMSAVIIAMGAVAMAVAGYFGWKEWKK